MNILSLFDGISGGQLSLKKANIKYDTYYASEIDKYAMAITKYNFPDTIQLGNIKKINENELPEIDLIIAGFPCQSHSLAGKRKGFNDERGELFFDLLKIHNKVKPKYFLYENVSGMKQEDKNFICKELDCNFIRINSSLLTAQNRDRIYFTNIKGNKKDLLGNIIEQPKDKNIILKDILEDDVDSSFNISAQHTNSMIKCRKSKKLNIPEINGKCGTITASYYKIPQDAPYIELKKPIRIGNLGNGSQGQRVYSTEGKSITLSSLGGGMGGKTGLYITDSIVRKLTPIECERLQGLPDDYTKYGIFDNCIKEISNTQRYKTIGNGFTIDVVSYILEHIKNH